MNLNKNICFFDLETTGINIIKDRIIELSILKLNIDNSIYKKTWRVNPGIPIPNEQSLIHGIYDVDVVHCKYFKEIAPEIINIIKDSDLAGFNCNRFDIPLLAEEFIRNGFDFDFSKIRSIDIQVIYHKMEPRNLSAAYKYYCNKELHNAHSAEADTIATYDIFLEQLNKYKELQKLNNEELSKISSHFDYVDLAGYIIKDNNGNEIINFGKYKGRYVKDILKNDVGYYNWIQSAEFPLYTKKIFTRLKFSLNYP